MQDTDRDRIQQNVCNILQWYIFNTDLDYHVDNFSIDCRGFRNNNSVPYMAVVQEPENNNTYFKKLIDSSFPYKIVISRDKAMINKMPNNKKILCFLPPDASEHDFEDYIKSMPGAIKREGC